MKPARPEKPVPRTRLERLFGRVANGTETGVRRMIFRRNEGSGPWWLSAEWMVTASLRGIYLGTLLKGWWTLGRKHTRDSCEVAVAIGGEDNMLQVGFAIPWVGRCYVGVRIPRWLTKRWVFERREIAVRPGYIGDILWVDVLYDDTAADMGDYYAKQRRDPKGGSCADCNHPGYCHDINPPDGHLLYGARYTRQGDPTEVTAYFTADSDEAAAAYFERRYTEHFPGAQMLGPEPIPPDVVKCWNAIGTQNWTPCEKRCKGWVKGGYRPSRAATWPGWRLKVRSAPLLDRLLGPMVHTSKLIGTYPVWKDGKPLGLKQVVALPEGNYPCRVLLREDTWERKRWPLSRRVIKRADVDMDEPIPVPGKGENSYDIDDDATFAMTLPASTIAEALGKVAENALRTREQRASRSWTPTNGWPRGIVDRRA